MNERAFAKRYGLALASVIVVALASLACVTVTDADGETGGGWYYDQLNPVEKAIYDSARSGLSYYVPEPYSSMSSEEFYDVVTSCMENPYRALKCEWTLGNHGNENLGISMGYDENGNYVTASMAHTSLYTEAYDETAYEEIMAALQYVQVDTESRLTAVTSIHDAVCAMLEYDEGTSRTERDYSLYNAVCENHIVVCEGYAKTFLALCQIHDIPCVGVLGNALTAKGWELHMYNMVQMDDGEWYGVDTTWDDQDEIVHTYLLAGTNTVGFNGVPFGTSHVPNGLTPPPLADETYDPVFVKYVFDTDSGTLTFTGTGTIPAGSESSPWYAFKDATTSIVIEDGITSIGAKAFYGFTNVQTVSIGADVASIGTKAFAYCESLESLTIPGNVETVGGYAFYHGGVKSLTLAKGVATIKDRAFQSCPLEHVVFASTITKIGAGAFSGCAFYDADGKTRLSQTPDLLAGYTFDGTPSELVLVTKFVKGFTFYKGSIQYSVTSSLASDRQLAVVGCKEGVSDLVIPAKVKTTAGYFPVTSVGAKAFYCNTELRSVDLGDVSVIGTKAFAKCTSLESLEMRDSVKTVSKYAFFGCSSLTTLDVSGNGTMIDVSAFSGCRNLTSVTFSGSGITISTNSFYNCLSMTSLDLTGVSSIGSKAFPYCNGITSLTVPGTVRTIGSYAFYKCANLTDLVISDGVKKIGKSAFSGCGMITSVDFGSTITSIGANAFYKYTFTDADGNVLDHTPANLSGHLFQGSGKILALAE